VYSAQSWLLSRGSTSDFKITFKPIPKQIIYNNVLLFSLPLSFVDYSVKDIFIENETKDMGSIGQTIA